MSAIWLICAGDSILEPAATQAIDQSAQDLAYAVARAVSEHRFTALYVTDTPAAMQMAIPCAQLNNLIPVTCNSLAESSIMQAGSTPQDIQCKLQELVMRHDTGDLVIFASSAACRRLIGGALGLPADHNTEIHQEPGAINRIIVDPQRIIVTGVNDLCHIDVK